MTQIGTISLLATIDTSGYKKDVKELEKTTKDVSNSISSDIDKGSSKASSSISGLGTKMVGFAATITAAIGITKALGSSLSDLAGLQTARSGFEVLTGSAEKASQVMKDIGKYANTTPFEFPEIANSAKTLLGFGVDAKDVQSNIENLGNAVAASGGDFSNVSRVFGQIFAAGKVNAEDFNQLIDNGIALGPEISKQLGIPMSQLKDNIAGGKVTFDVFNRALQSASSQGGKYFGATAKLSETLNGRISTLKDTFTGFVGKVVGVDFGTGIVSADGAFANFSNTIKFATDFLSTTGVVAFDNFKISATNMWVEIVKIATSVGNYLLPKLQGLWNTVNDDIIPILKDLWQNVLVPLAPIFGEVLVGGIGLAIDAMKLIFEWLGKIYQGFKDGDTIIIGLATTFGILAAAMAFNAIFNALSVGFATLTLVTIPSVMTSVGALAALIASPIVMPAIAVGAALAAIASVWAAYNEMKSAIDGMRTAQQNLISTNKSAYEVFSRIANDGVSSPEAKANARKQMDRIANMKIPALADGGIVSSATLAVIGEGREPEAVVPLSKLDDMINGGSNSSNTTISLNLSGIMTSSPSEERSLAKRLIERLNEQLIANGKTELAI